MIDYQKHWNEYANKCRIRGGAYVPHARHVTENGGIGDCIPMDNLAYMEMLYDKQHKEN